MKISPSAPEAKELEQALADPALRARLAHALASDRDRSVEVGCSDFDTKPVDMQRLLGKIRGCLPAPAQENAVA